MKAVSSAKQCSNLKKLSSGAEFSINKTAFPIIYYHNFNNTSFGKYITNY